MNYMFIIFCIYLLGKLTFEAVKLKKFGVKKIFFFNFNSARMHKIVQK